MVFFFQRNTFQLVLITDEVHSFAVFMYNETNWTKHTQVYLKISILVIYSEF